MASVDPLRATDRRALGWGVAASLALSALGGFWALPHIEDELDEDAQTVDSFVEVAGASIEWNGRDGYLRVPEGTENAEQIAADLADLSGTRDVEIEFVAPAGGSDTGDGSGDSGSSGDDNESTSTTSVETTPAEFEVTWTATERSASGTVPAAVAADLNDTFGTDGDLVGDTAVSLEPATLSALTDDIAPLIGNELAEGTLGVADETITLSGPVADATTLLEIQDRLGDVPGLQLDLTAPTVFQVDWDAANRTQTGVAPTALAESIGALGVAEPVVADGLTSADPVASTLSALAPFVGTDLGAGSVSVDGDLVTVTATATSQAGLDAAAAALGATGAEVALSLDDNAAAQVGIDRLLALVDIEFETGTAIPTAATESVIAEVAAVLTEFPTVAVTITGHTDSAGSAAFNQILSEQRATVVVERLVASGIDPTRLTAAGMGASAPIDTNDTPEGRQRNRRVEIDVKEGN